ncbi:MAG TPA: aldehyde dehydrogenase family protein, partial [Acidothermaceae bacterium]|nr:aldehyde dehydrogenase family protein [Acidothermaceae bacterium]
RAKLVGAWAQLIRANADEIAALDTATVGRMTKDAKNDVARSVGELEHWAAQGPEYLLRAERSSIASTLFMTGAEPVGVCGLLLPGNVPSRMFLVHSAIALGLGNAVVAKPAEYAPLSALRFAELSVEAGIPAGVVNVVTGAGSVGAALVDHPDVGGLSFTGSTSTGALVAVGAAKRFAKIALELGGKSPQIIFGDADLDIAAEAVVWSVCSNAGQVCTAGTRALIHESVYDEMLAKIAQLVAKVRVGDPVRRDVHIGPLSTRRQYDRVVEMVESGKQETRLVFGGEPAPEAGPGYYFRPTIFADVQPTARVFQEEIFGPVLCATPFGDDAEAVALANNSHYGLVANIWTADFRRAMRTANALDVGTVWYGSSRIGDPHMPVRAGSKSGGSHLRGLVDVFTKDKTIGAPYGATDYGTTWNLKEMTSR